MAVPTLKSCTLTRPLQQHGVTSAAQAPMINGNGATVASTLKQYGFASAGTDKFEAKDGSWIQFNPSRKTWERGIGNVVFRGLPKKLSDLPQQTYSLSAHGNTALGTLPKLSVSNTASAANQLKRAGFSQVLGSYYSHPDGSWVAFVGQRVLAGRGAMQLVGTPGVGGSQGQHTEQVATEPSAGPSKGKADFPVYETLPFPNDWAAWQKNFAIAKIPRADGVNRAEYKAFTAEEMIRIFEYLGFVDKGAGSWEHPDGSKVKLSGDRVVSSSFQKFGFGNFPYKLQKHWQAWRIEMKAWKAWLHDGASAPYPKG